MVGRAFLHSKQPIIRLRPVDWPESGLRASQPPTDQNPDEDPQLYDLDPWKYSQMIQISFIYASIRIRSIQIKSRYTAVGFHNRDQSGSLHIIRRTTVTNTCCMQCIASFTELYLARSNSNPTSKKAYSVLQLIQVPNPTCFRPNINFVIARAQCSKRGMASGRISAIFPRKPKRPSELFEYRRLKNEPPARWHKDWKELQCCVVVMLAANIVRGSRYLSNTSGARDYPDRPQYEHDNVA
ncbi:hypothetical protein EYR41_004676 [Orbilia oligospora]|uniref:Uncharacterized protein n=1 Tax=Orbilia oligospora TaxID=2813651 RepID=A0A7C8K592_ORBOL|nr:hypothetical protein TWF751_011217 [Orbilia oligospora]TGJ72808.1 hypothetical protein EYR41_004676 [Orbilia oligospora]